MGKVKKIIAQYSAVISIVVLTVIFTAVNKNFLGAFNVKNLFLDASTLLVIAAGVSFPVFLGSTDLSVGHIASLACTIVGTYIGDYGNIIIPFVAITGAIVGYINGYLHVTFKLPAFVVTLCTGNIFAVLAKIIAGGGAVPIPVDKLGLIAWAKLTPFGIPILFVISFGLTMVLYVVQKWSVLGKGIFAVGSNEIAANTMGVNVRQAKLMSFVLSGTFASICGILLSLKMKSNSPTAGADLTLTAIAAVALGGTSLFGGKGGVLETLAGVVLVTIIKNGLNLFGVDAFWMDIVFGSLLILAIAVRRDGSEHATVK